MLPEIVSCQHTHRTVACCRVDGRMITVPAIIPNNYGPSNDSGPWRWRLDIASLWLGFMVYSFGEGLRLCGSGCGFYLCSSEQVNHIARTYRTPPVTLRTLCRFSGPDVLQARLRSEGARCRFSGSDVLRGMTPAASFTRLRKADG